MRKSFELLFICLIAYLPGSVAQQHLDVFHVSYGYSPPAPYEEEAGKTPLHHARLNMTFPFELNSKTVLIASLSGFSNRLRLDPASTGSVNLFSLNLSLGIQLEYGNNWSGTHMIIPRLSTAFNNARDGKQIATVHLLKKQRTKNSAFSLGFYLGEESYGSMLVPILGYYFKDVSERWEIQLFLPARGDINYRFSPRWTSGIVFDGLGSTHDFETTEFGKAYVQRISNDLQLYLQVDLSKSMLLAFRTGYAFFRSFRVYDEQDTAGLSLAGFFFNDPRTPLNTSVKDGFLFSMRFTYRVHL